MPPLTPPGQAALRVAGQLGIEGPVLTLTTACSSSANALLVAAALLRRGEARRALVIGVEGLSAIALSGFHSLMLLDPEGCRPFDAGRRGMQIGEAVGAVLLEAGDAARPENCSCVSGTSAIPGGRISRVGETCENPRVICTSRESNESLHVRDLRLRL